MDRTPSFKAESVQSLIERFGALPLPFVFLIAFTGVALSHFTLLHLPYFWDEGGYYVPAALDFYRTGTLIPVFTNAHPPLPSVVLGSLWHLFGLHILVTRLTACALAAMGLTSAFVLGMRLVGPGAGLLLALLTAIYPIWFAQSSLAHADIFAAAFSLAGLSLYLTSPELIGSCNRNLSPKRRLIGCSALFCLSVLSKETAIVQPLSLAVISAYLAYRCRDNPQRMRAHGSWTTALIAPLPILAAWYAYHYLKTGQIFGNPVYLRYNATDNFTLAHVFYALRIRFVHLFWQRNIWLPLLLAATALLLPSRVTRRSEDASKTLGLARPVAGAIGVLLLSNLFAFSVLGGALLTRYLLPMYPLLLLVCIAVWRNRTERWPWLGALTAAAFLPAIWLNPSTFFAPEDNLTYRNMIAVQQQAIDYLNGHFPDATVLTAWPVSADLFRPELGYTDHTFRVVSIENFTAPELAKAAGDPGSYDTAVVFTTHYTSPSFRSFLLTHPQSWRGRRYAADIDLAPTEIARTLGGEVVWQNNVYGEWAAVLRFHRTYDAHLNWPGTLPDAFCINGPYRWISCLR